VFNDENLDAKLSSQSWTFGINSEAPKMMSKATESNRRAPVDIPRAFARVNEKTAKKVKLRIKPVTTPRGRHFPFDSEPDRTMGRIGRMHGDSIVTSPPINENPSNRII
jgi:hypothetical protein